MSDKFEKSWENAQVAGWKNDKEDIVNFFIRFNLKISDIYDHITSLNYDKMQVICYALSKVEKAMKICDFLDDLEKNKQDDVDVIKVFLLISHAEIVMNNFTQEEKTKKELVNSFFEPVRNKHKLDLKIRLIPKKSPCDAVLCGPDVFYKIRNDYVHAGNYTGVIFRGKGSNECSYNVFSFSQNNKICTGECNLTYEEFVNIFMDALIENIKIFSNYKSDSS